MTQLYSIQLLRGFVVSLVFGHHFMSPFYNFKPTNWLGDIFSNYGGFGVDIFFVISGFIMAYILYGRNYSAKVFMLNRVIRIIPTYWFWTMVLLILTLGLGVDTLFVQDANLSTIVKSLLFITHEHPSSLLGAYPVLTVGWTLNIEMFFYATIALLLLFKRSTDITLVILIVLFIVVPTLWHVLDLNFYKKVIGNIRLYEFSTGMFLAFIWNFYKAFLNDKIFIYFIMLSFIILFFLPIPLNYKWVINASLLVYLALLLEDSLPMNAVIVKILSFLGKISFSLYLIHGIVIRTLYYLFGEIESSIECATLFIVAMLISLLLALGSFEFMERRLSILLKKKI